jgi:hypothetical protein
MSVKKIDLNTGELIFFASEPTAGINYDLEGNSYKFVSNGTNLVDVFSGRVMVDNGGENGQTQVDYWNNVAFLYNFDSDFTDSGPNALGALSVGGGSPSINTSEKKFGDGSLSLNGSDQWLYLTDNDVLNATGEFTIAAWVYRSSFGDDCVCELGVFNSGGLLFRLGNTVINSYLLGGGVANGGSMSGSAWHHVMLVRNSSGLVISFIDGVAITSTSKPGTMSPTVDTRIGRANHNHSDWFHGYIDNLIWIPGYCMHTDSFTLPPVAYGQYAVENENLPRYQNPGGTGDRESSITLTTNFGYNNSIADLLNGSYSNEGYFQNTADVTGKYIQADFGTPRVVNQWRFRSAGNNAMGNYQPQASNNGSDWTNIGSPRACTMAATVDFDNNTTAYRYYRLLGTSGSLSQNWNQELEFRIDPGT